MIKMVMAMRHGVLPRTLHIDHPSAQVDWSQGAVALLSESLPWPQIERPRRAGVSSFGMSGTNAHVILEQAPVEQQSPQKGRCLVADGGVEELSDELNSEEIVPWVLSARSEAGLRAQATRLFDSLLLDPQAEISDIGYSLALRPVLDVRAVIAGVDRDSLMGDLGALAVGEHRARIFKGATRLEGTAGGLAFLFSGQGSQRVGMGAELYRSLPFFRTALDRVCGQFDALLERPLLAVMHDDAVFSEGSTGPLLDETVYTQAGLFALEVALFRLLEAWGVQPGLLLGHSIGELVAAHVGGVLSLEDACTLVAARGRLMQALPEGGAMVAVQASELEVLSTLEGLQASVALAAVNAPEAVVLSGDEDAVLELADTWRKRGRKVRRLQVSHAFHSPRMDTMLDEFLRVAQTLSYQAPQIPIVSNVTGEVASEELCSPEYWVAHVRKAVRFADCIARLTDNGVSRFLEVGPDGVLSAMTRECLDDQAREGSLPVAVSMLRGERSERSSLTEALAAVWTAGELVEWQTAFEERHVRRLRLPTYAFQRKRYWLNAGGGVGDLASIGQAAGGHPLLEASIQLGGGEGLLFTGRLSLDDHPWLRDHAVMGSVLLPGTAFLELALSVGADAGTPRVDELTIEAPLVLSENESAQIQVSVGELEELGARPIKIYSRSKSDQAWITHASGLLSPGGVPTTQVAMNGSTQVLCGVWPPQGSEAIEVERLYDRLAESGFEYGEAFRAVQAAWSRGGDMFAEVRLADARHAEADSFGIHPALLDSAFHVALDPSQSGQSDSGLPRLPFCWRGVELHASGALSLRLHLKITGTDEVSLRLADQSGAAVATVESVVARAASSVQIEAAGIGYRDSLLTVEWEGLPARPAAILAGSLALLAGEQGVLAQALGEAGARVEIHEDLGGLSGSIQAGAPVPDAVLLDCTGGSSGASSADLLTAVHGAARKALSIAKEWLADERLSASRLVFVTHGSVAVQPTDPLADLAGAPVWGLIRSAQAESPARFMLVDIDRSPASLTGLLATLATVISDERTQLAVRDGVLYVPRLARVDELRLRPDLDRTEDSRLDAAEDSDRAPWLDPDGTVLITGGTGGLGAIMAGHLVDRGARHLLLVSRRGLEADGAVELQAQLGEQGAQVTVAACDVADRDQLGAVIDSIQPEHPLKVVIHAAGINDNALIQSLTVEQLERVLRSKVDGALGLHELTVERELDAFVLFSSMSGVFGGPGQGNYAAANAFLDALACRRRTQGLVATSMAWGLWSDVGMGRELGELDMRRMTGTASLGTVTVPEALSLFAPALAGEQAIVLPARLDRAILRAEGRSGAPPALLHRLAGVQTRLRVARSGTLAQRIAGVSASQGQALVEDLVRGEVAAVLGYSSPQEIDPDIAFKDLGFDSLAAVELRNRLDPLTGLRLPATLIFDRPTCAALTRHLLQELAGAPTSEPSSTAQVARAQEPIAIVGIGCRSQEVCCRLRDSGSWCAKVVRASLASPPTAGGTSTRCTTPTPSVPARAIRARAGFSTKQQSSMLISLASAQGRRWLWTLSSVCSWKRLGRRLSTRASILCRWWGVPRVCLPV